MQQRRIQQTSLPHLAAEAVRDMILAGELRPGERLVEERLTDALGISRPPLREALRLLEREGLISHHPRRGAIVTTLSEQDVYEVWTLRAALERLALELGMPVGDAARLERCHVALRGMDESARRSDRAGLVRSAFQFHLAIVGLAGHRRLEEAYQSLQLQMHLWMAANTQVRERHQETLAENVARHRLLLDLVEAGDRAAALAELERHGDHAYLRELTDELAGGVAV